MSKMSQFFAQNLPVGSRLHQFWETWATLGASPNVIKILREGYTLPFRIRPPMTRLPTIISGYVHPLRNSYLTEALHALMQNQAVEIVRTQKSLGFSNQLFLVPKINNQWRSILDLSTLIKFLRQRKFKMEIPQSIRTLPPGWRVGNVHRLLERQFLHPNTHTIKGVPAFSCPRSILPVQSPTVWSVHSPHGIQHSAEGGQTDGSTQRYKNPPVPRQLFGQSHGLPNLSQAYSYSNSLVSGTRLDSEHRQIITGAQTGLRLCRLPVQPQGGQGQTNPGTLTD